MYSNNTARVHDSDLRKADLVPSMRDMKALDKFLLRFFSKQTFQCDNAKDFLEQSGFQVPNKRARDKHAKPLVAKSKRPSRGDVELELLPLIFSKRDSRCQSEACG